MAETNDFFMAVYLLAMDEELSDLQVKPKEVFQFTDSPTLPERMAAYRDNTALVNPKHFAREIMKLRQRLHKLHQEAE